MMIDMIFAVLFTACVYHLFVVIGDLYQTL